MHPLHWIVSSWTSGQTARQTDMVNGQTRDCTGSEQPQCGLVGPSAQVRDCGPHPSGTPGDALTCALPVAPNGAPPWDDRTLLQS